ncbi:MAG: hypothetical protein ACUVUF_06995, partial [Candidatus Bathycorpusculaceae bacterium]
MDEKYKIIEESLNREVNSVEFAIIKELEKRFSRKNFFFQIENSKVLFHLNSIDLNAFRRCLQDLERQYKYVPSDKDIFSEILSKIENIKSYGVKAGKRIYVDYAKERKVRNRQRKVLQRG